MTKLRFKFMDLLLLSAPDDNPCCFRSCRAIVNDIMKKFELRVPDFSKENILKFTKPGWIEIRDNEHKTEFFSPTKKGLSEHFLIDYGVEHFIEKDRPFGGGILDSLGQWFDVYFSPKSNMNSRLEETNIPGAYLGGGTKWREASWLFQTWNQPHRYTYISALLFHLLDPEQWPGKEEERAAAWDGVDSIFRPSGYRVHEKGFLIPALKKEESKLNLTAWDDEKRFRSEIIEPMLRKMSGVINVVHTHGKDEFGRDFIFDYRHPLLGDRRWVAVQVKSGDLSATAGSELRTIFDQVMMCFEHPIIDLGSMGNVATSEVIVLISGRFTGNAKQRILDGIKDPVWRANIFFLDRNGIEAILRGLA